jgi:uncharacterized protein
MPSALFPFACISIFLLCSACGEAQNRVANTQDHQEVVRFDSEGDTLEGLLEVPALAVAEKGKIPLIVFVHGSGRATRSDYEGICDRLHESGFATFRYDKRGIGKSGGSFQELGPYNSKERVRLLAADAAAAVKKNCEKSWFDKEKIIVMGVSQAGWIIPVVCSLSDVSAAVIISGPTVSVGEEIYYSEFAEHGSTSQVDADKLLPDFKGVHGFDNIDYVSRMKQPSLWVFGGKDVSIPVKECLRRLEAAKAANSLPVEIKLFPAGDHGLFNSEKQRPEDYMNFVIEWLEKL